MLFGVTYYGGTSNAGTLFRIQPSGSSYKTMRYFKGDVTDGGNPNTLLQGSDGRLYGTTYAGAKFALGEVFSTKSDGSGYTVLHTMTTIGGGYPTTLLQASDGNLYGTTYYDSGNGAGTVFRLTTTGANFKFIYNFATGSGYSPYSLIQGSDGNLYGGNTAGGVYGQGGVFRMTTSGSGYAALANFGQNTTDPTGYEYLMQGADGRLYGVSTSGGTINTGAVFALYKAGTNYSVLYNFISYRDGYSPVGKLVHSTDGYLYGLTNGGGIYGYGTFYRIKTDGTGYNILYNFTSAYNSPNCLILATDGFFYATTLYGGANGGGSIIQLTSAGKLKLLWNFVAGTGAYPNGIVQGADGLFYGTTSQGGVTNYGTMFRFTPTTKSFKMLHSFSSGSDGGNPYATPILASDGYVYATTTTGGLHAYGTVCKVAANGGSYKKIYDFATTDGISTTGLLQAADGTLYGATYPGGANSLGKIYRMGLDGKNFKTIYSFANSTDGYYPSSLMQGSDGKLYGADWYGGGSAAVGEIFRVNTDGGNFTPLYTFLGLPDGAYPNSLMQGLDGSFYGSTPTNGGGAANLGTLFKWVP